jgi:hypothetical protein
VPEALPTRQPDLPTIAACACLAYIISNVLHEALGHGGAALLSGARHLTLTTTYLDADVDNRWIEAAGTLANLIAGPLFLAALAVAHRAGPLTRYFLWLCAAFNLLLGTGYFGYSGLLNQGDWAVVLHGLRPAWAWHAAVFLGGVGLYFGSMVLLARSLGRRVIGGRPTRPVLRRLTWIPYFAAGVLACVAALRNPLGWKLILLSAAASSFGGAAGLLSLGRLVPCSVQQGAAPAVFSLPRQWPLIAATCVIVLFDVLVLGHGLHWSR